MRDQPTSPQLPLANAPPAPVMRAVASESIAASAATQRPIKRPRQKAGPATAVWAIAGVLAASYVGALLMGHEPVTLLAGRMITQERDTSDMSAALARTQSEVAQLQRTVGTLEADLGRVKGQTSQVEARERAAAARIDAVETRVERFGSQIAQVFAKATPAQKAQPVIAATRPVGASIETGTLPPKEAAGAQRELSATRHAAPEAALPTTPTAQSPSQQPSAILLARGPSLDALRLSWSLLNERHKVSLGTLEPRVVTSEPGTHQLVAGPFASPADAAKVCATLKSRGVTCQPAEFKGEAL